MQEREFWQLLEEVLGRSYGRALARDQVLDRLNGLTAVEALEMGEEPRMVWNVLCDQMNIPDSKRWGKDHKRATNAGALGGVRLSQNTDFEQMFG